MVVPGSVVVSGGGGESVVVVVIVVVAAPGWHLSMCQPVVEPVGGRDLLRVPVVQLNTCNEVNVK